MEETERQPPRQPPHLLSQSSFPALGDLGSVQSSQKMLCLNQRCVSECLSVREVFWECGHGMLTAQLPRSCSVTCPHWHGAEHLTGKRGKTCGVGEESLTVKAKVFECTSLTQETPTEGIWFTDASAKRINGKWHYKATALNKSSGE